MSDTPPPSRSRRTSTIITVLLILLAIVAWAFAASATTPAGRIGLFALASALLVGAFGRRHIWPALVTLGVLSMAMQPPDERTWTGWTVFFLATMVTGTFMWLRRWPGLRWMAASIPVVAYAKVATWVEMTGIGMFFVGLLIAAVSPTLPTRRRRLDLAPMPHLSAGALTSVEPRIYPGAHGVRIIAIGGWVFVALMVVLLGFSAREGADPALATLALACAIIASTCAFSYWFSGRVRVRVDGSGVHGRTAFFEHTIKWSDVAALRLRYVFLPGYGIRLVYYCVQSPDREVSFPSSMKNAASLQASIEAATGTTFPTPEIEANF